MKGLKRFLTVLVLGYVVGCAALGRALVAGAANAGQNGGRNTTPPPPPPAPRGRVTAHDQEAIQRPQPHPPSER